MIDPYHDRREYPPELLQLVQHTHDTVLALDRKLSEHMTSETKELEAAMLRLMSDAFPAGDPGGHKRHHEAVIKEAEDRAEFWHKMRLELAKWGLLGFLGWAIVSLWQTFLHGPK